MEVFNESFLTIEWDARAQCVIMRWKAFAKGDDFREGLNKGLEVLTQKRAHKWLADMRLMQVLTMADQTWSNEDWFPRAIKGGVRKMALVQPQSALAKMGVKNIMTKLDDVELETANFATVEEAINWLK